MAFRKTPLEALRGSAILVAYTCIFREHVVKEKHHVPSICINAAIRRASRRLGQLYDEAFAPCGLRATQYSLLVQIERGKKPTMRVLADMLVMDLSALGHTLKPLERDGLIELMQDPDDRRSRRVQLTQAGTAKLKAARARWKKVNESFDSTFGPAEAASLRSTLDLIASDHFYEQVSAELEAR
jgi:DNA-binding MarR family transcriptional regulator